MQADNKKIALITYLTLLGLVCAWVAGAVILPRLEGAGAWGTLVSAIVHYGYGRVCHQISDRCLHLAGLPMAVCARCFGIYLGYLAGLAVYPRVRPIETVDAPPRRWLVIALIPLSIDFLGGYLGVFENTQISRLLTGLIAGAACSLYTVPGIVSMAVSCIRPGLARRVRLKTRLAVETQNG